MGTGHRCWLYGGSSEKGITPKGKAKCAMRNAKCGERYAQCEMRDTQYQ
jgi:hypothetical protein